MKAIKISAIGIAIVLCGMNLYHAMGYYGLDRIRLADQFYWQSINDVVVDNGIERKQNITVSFGSPLSPQPINMHTDTTLIYVIKRDSYHEDW